MTSELDRLLIATDPIEGSAEQLSAASRDVGLLAEAVSQLGLQPAPERRRSRRKRILIGVSIGLAVTPGVAWAAHRFMAETGVFGKPGMTENDTSQYVDVCAKDFPQYFATLPTPTSTPPSGLTWRTIEGFIVEQIRHGSASDCRSGGEVQQVTGLKSKYLLTAETVLECRAYQANKRGNATSTRANLRAAADVMDQIDKMGIWGDRNWIPFRDAARAGDLPVMAQYWSANVVGAPTPEGTCR